MVSCVTKDAEPKCKPHPHSLVGRDCKKGVCTVRVKDASVVRYVFNLFGAVCFVFFNSLKGGKGRMEGSEEVASLPELQGLRNGEDVLKN